MSRIILGVSALLLVGGCVDGPSPTELECRRIEVELYTSIDSAGGYLTDSIKAVCADGRVRTEVRP